MDLKPLPICKLLLHIMGKINVCIVFIQNIPV